MQKGKRSFQRRTEKRELQFFTLAIIGGYPQDIQDIYSKVSPDLSVQAAREKILLLKNEVLAVEWDNYVKEALELEAYFNRLFSVAMPVFKDITMTTEVGGKYQLVSVDYEKMIGYEGLRVRLLFTKF